MNMQNKKKLLLLSLIQFVLLLTLIGNIMYFKQSAETFKIESKSLDPIEPLLGHYASLTYSFDTINMKDWQGKSEPKDGKAAYIVFKEDHQNSIYVFNYASDHRPTHAKYIKATIQYSYDDGEDGKKIVLNHNLSRFYIPERQMDKFNNESDFIVTVQQKGDRSIVKSVDLPH
ncbi:hypothetical protein CN601_17900 [Bacillus sp. AFS017336]|nr:hypothetical protein CN601_17900 [Bacillus sp. AFS017336]